MYKKIRKLFVCCITGATVVTSVLGQGVPFTIAYAQEVVSEELRAEIEASLYDFEYYTMANEDVAVALGYDKEKLYEHWLNFGMAEGRNASMVFNAKYYLEVNPSVKAVVGNDYVAAYEHFVTTGLLVGLESSPVFSVKYYLEANQDVAGVFGNDYVKAANHFNQNALAEGRSGSGNFDYTVYKNCNTDVAQLYGDEIKGYYIHYINHGRAEGRTAGLGGSNEGGNTGGTVEIDETTASYRIFDAKFYLEKYPELKETVGTEEQALYLYWINEGIEKGQTASPVIVPEEYLKLNKDVAEVFGENKADALKHFLNAGILEGRTGSYEFDYSIYAYCNTDVGDVFIDDIVGYYFHYVKYGKAENRTAAAYVPPSEPEVTPTPTPSVTPDTTPTPMPEVTPSITPTPEAGEKVTVTNAKGMKFELRFNEKGQMSVQNCYATDGTLLAKNQIEYSANGNIEKVICSDNQGNSIGYMYYYYDNYAGKLSQKTGYNTSDDMKLYYAELIQKNADGSVSCDFYELDAQLQKTEVFRNSGAVASSIVTKYTDGKANRSTWYTADGNVDYYEVYEQYNMDGTIGSSSIYNANNSKIAYTAYSYYSTGVVKQVTTYDMDGTVLSCNYYNQNGYQEKNCYYNYNDKGELSNYTVLEYNEEYQLIGNTIYHADDTLYGYWIYEYDETNGCRQKETFYNASSQIAQYVTYKYHANGEQKSATWYNADGNKSVVIEYNENGVIARENYYDSNSNLEGYVLYECYATGKVKKESYYVGETDKLFCTYEYDEKGNCVGYTTY